MTKIKFAIQKLKVGWLKRNLRNPVVDIQRHLSDSGRILVLLPSSKTLRKGILGDSDFLSRSFRSSEICLVSMPDDDVRDVARKEGFRSFTPHRLELSWYGFPRKAFFNRIRNLKSRIVIDLDVQRSCFNAAISAVSGAPLRVGHFGIWGPPIHNVEIKSDRFEDQVEDYQSMLNVLSSLKAGASN